MTKPVLYLVDGSSYIYRAYYALRNLSSHKGFPTNAVFGFTKMLLKVMKERRPDHLAVVFDAGRATFRHDLYPDYKANRVAMPDDLRVQIDPIKEMVRAFSIPVLELPGYEADDIIATIAKDCEETGMQAVVVTGDKDLMQIVTPDVTLLDTMKEKTTAIPDVVERFGVPPEGVIDVLGLAGDTSDNIPGVPGVGEKTAMKLLAQYGSLDELLERAAEVKGKVGENLRAFADQARLSRQLATVDRAVPIEWSYDDFAASPPDNGRLAELFREYGFTALMQELTSAPTLTTENYRTVLTGDDLRSLTAELMNAEAVALEVETARPGDYSSEIIGIALCFREHEAWYVPAGHRYLGAPEQLPAADLLEALRPFLESESIRKIGHNLKFAVQVLSRYGIELRGVWCDVMLASYLLNPARSGHTLDSLAVELLDHRMISYAEVTGKGRDQKGLDEVQVEDAAAYACENADGIFLLHRLLLPRVAELGMERLLFDVEMPLVPVLAGMETCGVRLDLDLLLEISESLNRQLVELEKTIFSLAGCEFNINSPKQLGEVLFERLRLPAGKKTKTGWSTDIDVLTKLAQDHEIPKALLQYRSLMKLKSTYTDSLPKLVDPESGCVHTSYNQAVTNTGRLSSSDPNLQNIPIRTEEGRKIRRAFIPRPGWLMLSADYSQIELRVLAHLSGDRVFRDAFARDEDIHTRTASEIFDIFPQMVTPEMRRQAKTVNFGVIYGQTPFGLSQELGISTKLAKEFIDKYFERHSGARTFLDRCVKDAEEKGYVTTILGRRLTIPDIHSPNFQLRSFAHRNAVNYPIQGSAADIIKQAMVRIAERMKREEVKSRLLMQVHDELVFEVPEEERLRMEQLVIHEMEHAVDLAVPLRVELNFGRNWHEAH
jgi:DNA polymerase I